jgi:hypothetical protein
VPNFTAVAVSAIVPTDSPYVTTNDLLEAAAETSDHIFPAPRL